MVPGAVVENTWTLAETTGFKLLFFLILGIADIALIAIREEKDGFGDRFACLPDKDDDPVSDCFEVSYQTGNGTRRTNNLKPGKHVNHDIRVLSW